MLEIGHLFTQGARRGHTCTLDTFLVFHLKQVYKKRWSGPGREGAVCLLVCPHLWFTFYYCSSWCRRWAAILHSGITWMSFEPPHEIMVLFVLRKLILQTRMRSHLVGLDIRFLVITFVYCHTLCVRTITALARLRECAGSPEPSLVAYVTSTIISGAGSIHCFWFMILF